MLERVRQYRETTDFHAIAQAYEVRTPAFAATVVVWECPAWPGIVMTFVTQPFDERLVLGLIRHVNAAWDGRPRGGMTILPGLSRVVPATSMPGARLKTRAAKK
jgi:hypothetical protein